MLNLFHVKCNMSLVVTLDKQDTLQGYVGFDKEKIKVVRVQLPSFILPKGGLEFVCRKCEKIVDSSEIIGECDHCHNMFPVKKLEKLTGVPGIYCKKGRKRFESDLDNIKTKSIDSYIKGD